MRDVQASRSGSRRRLNPGPAKRRGHEPGPSWHRPPGENPPARTRPAADTTTGPARDHDGPGRPSASWLRVPRYPTVMTPAARKVAIAPLASGTELLLVLHWPLCLPEVYRGAKAANLIW